MCSFVCYGLNDAPSQYIIDCYYTVDMTSCCIYIYVTWVSLMSSICDLSVIDVLGMDAKYWSGARFVPWIISMRYATFVNLNAVNLSNPQLCFRISDLDLLSMAHVSNLDLYKEFHSMCFMGIYHQEIVIVRIGQSTVFLQVNAWALIFRNRSKVGNRFNLDLKI